MEARASGPNFWAKKIGPHSDSVQIFEVINLYNRTVSHISKPLLACQNALKLTYSNVEFQKFSGGGPLDPRGGEGRGREGKGRKEKGGEASTPGLRPPKP